MDIQALTPFFIWCTVINGTLLVFWISICALAPDQVYQIQYRFFPLPRETFDTVLYCFLGVFKIAFLFLNVVPAVALLILA